MISILVNSAERAEEASTKIGKKIYSHLKSKNLDVVLNRKADLYNVHSSGFLEILKIRPVILSYYITPKSSYYGYLRSFIEYIIYFRDKKYDCRNLLQRFKHFFLNSLSYLIPMIAKRQIFKKAKLIVQLNSVKKQFKIPCKVIKIGIDITKFRKTKKKKGINIAYIGHNGPSRGLKEAIDSFAGIKNNIDVYLSDYSRNTAKYAKKINNNIKVHGRAGNIVDIYNQVDILVLPFRYENAGIVTPLVLLEAMACECAIITTDLPNIREICGDSVIYVSPYSVRQIQKAICYLIDSPGIRQKLGKMARKKVISDHNEKNMLNEYYNLLKNA